MSWLPNYTIDELNYSLEILRKDLTSMFFLCDEDRIPILYDVSVSTTEHTKDDEYVEQSPPESPKCNDDKIREALCSCHFYLHALSKERRFFDTSAYPNCNNGYVMLNKQTKKNILESDIDVKEHLELFKENAWTSFAEINSFCKSLMGVCKFLATHSAEADEVLCHFKHSIEVYERAISFDITCSDNAKEVLCALHNVKDSTRSLQTFLWTIKTLMTHAEPTTDI